MKNKTAKNLLIINICLCLAAINLQAAAGHSITLKPGLNLISIPGSPTESGKMAHEALGPVYDRTNAIWRIKESEWQVHVPSRPELSHFSSLQPGSGYFLYLTEGPDKEWTFDLPSQGVSISIVEGSNLVGYGGANDQPIEEIFAQAPGEIREFRTVIGGEWIAARRDDDSGDLTIMEVGRGYVAESDGSTSWFNRLVFSGGESSFAAPLAATIIETSDGLALEAADGEILVSVARQSTSEELGEFAAALAEAGMEIVGDGGSAGLIQVRFRTGTTFAEAETFINSLPAVSSTTPNLVVIPDFVPVSNEDGRHAFPHLVYDPANEIRFMSLAMETTDDHSVYPWWVGRIKADQAWGITEGSLHNRATIGIVDSGFIPDVIETDRLTTLNFDGKAMEDTGGTLGGHGNLVTLFAAGSGSNSAFENPAGVAKRNAVIYVDPVQSVGSGDTTVFITNLQQAASSAISNGARTVNISWGSRLSNAVEHTEENLLRLRRNWREGWTATLNSANDRDALIVFSAGNDGGGQTTHASFVPGSVTVHNDDQLYPTGSLEDANVWTTNALIVAATDLDNQPATFSRRGNVVNLAAPGQGVSPGGRFGNTQGTSFSAPMVTGAAGLVMSEAPGLRALEVRQILLNTADRSVIPGSHHKLGSGLLNVYEAVKTAGDLAGLPEEVLSVTLPNIGEAPLTRTVSITLPDSGVELLDVVFCVDVSGSYGSFINTFKSVASDIMNDIAAAVPNTRFAMTSFSDFPISPFGSAASGDKAYYLNQPLTGDIELVQQAIDDLRIYFGADLPESQLEALYQILTGAGRTVEGHPEANLEPRSVGWRTGALRVIILATDVRFHDSDTNSNYPGAGFSEVIDLLQSTGTIIIGLESPRLGATSGDMNRLVEATNGQIFGLDLAATGIADIILEGLELTLQQILVEPNILGDPYGYISSITPVSYQATPGETVEFTIEFSPQPRQRSEFARKSSVIWFTGDRSAVLKRVPVDTTIPRR